nr:Lsr2 family protein [uncultured Microbacterium sp.]
MAMKHITHLVDDLDGTVLEDGQGKQITFSVEGRAYEIDLSDRNADKFYSAISPFVDAARSVSRGNSTARRGRPARRGNDVDLGAVREWARANGHTVSDRGRVPATVLDAYAEANS